MYKTIWWNMDDQKNYGTDLTQQMYKMKKEWLR